VRQAETDSTSAIARCSEACARRTKPVAEMRASAEATPGAAGLTSTAEVTTATESSPTTAVGHRQAGVN